MPPYYPDAPEVRTDVANYHENVTAMDYLVGDMLKWLDDKKLADNTIVVLLRRPRLGDVARQAHGCTTAGCNVPFTRALAGSVKPEVYGREDLVAFWISHPQS